MQQEGSHCEGLLSVNLVIQLVSFWVTQPPALTSLSLPSLERTRILSAHQVWRIRWANIPSWIVRPGGYLGVTHLLSHYHLLRACLANSLPALIAPRSCYSTHASAVWADQYCCTLASSWSVAQFLARVLARGQSYVARSVLYRGPARTPRFTSMQTLGGPTSSCPVLGRF